MADQTITLAPGGGRLVTFEAIPHEARTYQVSVNGLTGRFVIAYAWWEGLPSWRQILASNEWPANTSIITRWKVENTGIVTTQFRVEFMGQSGSISLNPEESGDIEFIITTGDPSSYNYAASLYANGVLVDSTTIETAIVRIKAVFCWEQAWVNGEIVCIPKFWIYYDGLPDFQEFTGDHWRLPPRQGIRLLTQAKNTCDVAANFAVGLQPKFWEETTNIIWWSRERDVRLEPGHYGRFNIEFRTFGPGDGF